MTYEKVTLFGLTIASRRRVPLGPIDPRQSRQLLIEHGLAEGRLKPGRFDFLEHNQRVLHDLDELAARSRRSDLLVHPGELFDWFDQRLPDHVTDPGALAQWLQKCRRRGERPLHLSLESLLPTAQDGDQRQKFPEQLPAGQGLNLPVDYRFQPGDEDDGVSVSVPREALAQIDPRQLQWLVPGLLEEKVLALIRSLPKSLRRNFVPAPDVARQVAAELPFGDGDVLESLATRLSARAGEPVQASDFQIDRLPLHLHMRVNVTDEQGKVVASGRDLDELREILGADRQAANVIDDRRWRQTGLQDWCIDELPEQVAIRRGELTMPAFPALVDRGDSVDLQLLDQRDAAEQATRQGLVRLFALLERRELKSQVKWLPGLEKAHLLGGNLPQTGLLKQQLVDLLAARAFFAQPGIPRTADAFRARRQAARRELPAAAQDVAGFLKPLLEKHHAVRLLLETMRGSRHEALCAEVRDQVDTLTAAGFLSQTPWRHLQHVPRYLEAAAARLEKANSGGANRDRQLQAALAPWLEKWRGLPPSMQARAECQRFRWMLEEFRVSLFAQQLGTAEKVSARRLEKLWDEIQSPPRRDGA